MQKDTEVRCRLFFEEFEAWTKEYLQTYVTKKEFEEKMLEKVNKKDFTLIRSEFRDLREMSDHAVDQIRKGT